MSDADFLSAILAAPDDDTPRLVYADWLDEHGDPDRAEFIRVQCDLARTDDADPRRPGLEDREHELLEEHEPDWMGDPVRYLPEWEWHRGFVESVTANRLTLNGLDPSFAAKHPIRSVRNLGQQLADTGTYADWAGASWISTVRDIDCTGTYPDDSEFNLFLQRADLPEWVGLDWSRCPGIARVQDLFWHTRARRHLKQLAFGGRSGPGFQWADAQNETLDVPEFIKVLADAPLEDLSAFDCGLTSDGLRELLQAPFAGRLKRLDISDNPIAPDAYRAFQAAARDTRLEYLDVSGTPLAGISLEPLLASRACESLRELEMNRCGSARRNMEVLAESAFWSRATHLRLHSGTVPAFTLEPLCQSPGPPALRVLDLGDNYLRTEGVRLLCNAPWAGSLNWLALSRNYLDDDALRVIADTGRFVNLRTLHLAHNHVVELTDHLAVTDAGVRHLVEAPSLRNLRLLSLSHTGISDVSVDLALNAPHWRLSGLGVGYCDLSPAAVRTLAASPRLARLEWLDLSGNPRLSGDVLLELAESPYLSRRCELDVGGVYVSDRVRQALRDRLGPRLSE